LLVFAFLAAALAMPYGAARTVAADRVISGELVVLKGSPNRFRLVGNGGTFAAPAGTPLDSLDGRPVQVELSSNGRVESITEMPVRIDPVVSGWETARGQLQVRDTQTFTLAGADRVYVAPSSMDVRPYGGRLVEVRLDDAGRVTDLKLVSDPQSALQPPIPGASCVYGGQGYSDGATVCQGGTQFRCENNSWRNLGGVCGAPPPEPRSCMFGGATVANGSAICKEGATLRCSDGTWVSTQIACR
jgi:hypothetical protein